MIDFEHMAMGEVVDFFPDELVREAAILNDRLDEYYDCISTLHTSNLYDTSKITEGMCVIIKENNRKGTVTNYHLTDRGKMNGGIQVNLNGDIQTYYPNQVKLWITNI